MQLFNVLELSSGETCECKDEQGNVKNMLLSFLFMNNKLEYIK